METYASAALMKADGRSRKVSTHNHVSTNTSAPPTLPFCLCYLHDDNDTRNTWKTSFKTNTRTYKKGIIISTVYPTVWCIDKRNIKTFAYCREKLSVCGWVLLSSYNINSPMNSSPPAM
jgi:hypothetical protein